MVLLAKVVELLLLFFLLVFASAQAKHVREAKLAISVSVGYLGFGF